MEPKKANYTSTLVMLLRMISTTTLVDAIHQTQRNWPREWQRAYQKSRQQHKGQHFMSYLGCVVMRCVYKVYCSPRFVFVRRSGTRCWRPIS